jgi:hypothetical protein
VKLAPQPQPVCSQPQNVCRPGDPAQYLSTEAPGRILVTVGLIKRMMNHELTRKSLGRTKEKHEFEKKSVFN